MGTKMNVSLSHNMPGTGWPCCTCCVWVCLSYTSVFFHFHSEWEQSKSKNRAWTCWQMKRRGKGWGQSICVRTKQSRKVMLRNNEDGEKEKMNVCGGGGITVCLVEGNGWQRKGNNRHERENGKMAARNKSSLKKKKSKHKETAVKVAPFAASWAALCFQFKTILHKF